jgi:type III secretion system YscQ/HrcQ family protein
VPRTQVTALQRALSSLPRASHEGARLALTELLGAAVELVAGAPDGVEVGRLEASVAEPLVAVVLAATDQGPPYLALELDPRLAAFVVDRALGGAAGDSVGVPLGPLTDVERGVLAYVAARALAAIDDAPDLRVGTVVTTTDALRAAVGDAGCLVWPAGVRLGADRGTVRLWLPLGRRPAGQRGAASLSPVLRALPLTCTLEVGWATVAGGLLATVRPGDVLVLDEVLEPGEARLRVAAGRRVSATGRLEGTHFTVGRVVTRPEPAVRQGEVLDEATDEGALERVGDAPVELSVEVARLTLTVAELSALRPGQVLVTGAAVGGQVTLRAGDRAIAEGELVDVEGEIGVRVLRLAP